MRGSREILKDSQAKLLSSIEGISSNVSDLLLLAGKVLASAEAMRKEASAIQEQVRNQSQSGRRKAKLAFTGGREQLAQEALRHSLALELEAESLTAHSDRLKLLTEELSRWERDLRSMQNNLSSWSKLWIERRERTMIFPSLTLLGRMLRRMIRATSIIDKVNGIVDILKVDIEGIERLRAEAEPHGETFGWKYRMPPDLKAKLDARLKEEIAKLSRG